jgi:hypothetical protein
MRASSNIEVTACRDLATIFAARVNSAASVVRATLPLARPGRAGQFSVHLGFRFGDRDQGLRRQITPLLQSIHTSRMLLARTLDVLRVGDDE